MVLADEATPYFPMPAVPESMPLGSQRANYVVEHYWDFCPWKSAFSAPRRMQESLSTFAELLPLAQRDTAMTAVRSLVAQVNKKPDELLSLATMAEAVFYSDTAVVASDEAFLPFVQAVNKNKKIKGEAREHFERLESVITHSAEGLPVPSLKVRLADGSTVALNDTTSSASAYLIFFRQARRCLSSLRPSAPHRQCGSEQARRFRQPQAAAALSRQARRGLVDRRQHHARHLDGGSAGGGEKLFRLPP